MEKSTIVLNNGLTININKNGLDEKLICFTSYPDFMDNPRALWEFLRSISSLKCVWLVNEKTMYKRMVEAKIPTWLLKDPEATTLIIHAKYLVSSHCQFIKRPGQVLIDLWHGMPIKAGSFLEESIGKLKDSLITNKQAGIMSDIFPVTSKLMKIIISSLFCMDPRKVEVLGQSRSDLLFDSADDKLLSRVFGENILEFKKYILYAPTFRIGLRREGDGFENNIFNMDDYDPNLLQKILVSKQAVLMIKPHPNDEKLLNPKSLKLPENTVWLTTSLLQKNLTTLFHLLSKFDVLITDYSSVYIDYLLLNRPVLFTIGDFDLYQKERGFVVDDPTLLMPGPFINSCQSLGKALKASLEEPEFYQEERKRAMKLLHTYPDNQARSRLWSAMQRVAKKGSENVDLEILPKYFDIGSPLSPFSEILINKIKSDMDRNNNSDEKDILLREAVPETIIKTQKVLEKIQAEIEEINSQNLLIEKKRENENVLIQAKLEEINSQNLLIEKKRENENVLIQAKLEEINSSNLQKKEKESGLSTPLELNGINLIKIFSRSKWILKNEGILPLMHAFSRNTTRIVKKKVHSDTVPHQLITVNKFKSDDPVKNSENIDTQPDLWKEITSNKEIRKGRVYRPDSNRKNVAYFTNQLLDWTDQRPRFGGGERYCINLVILLRELGFEVDIFQLAPKSFEGEYYGNRVQAIEHGEFYSEFNIGAANTFYEKSRLYDHVIYNMPELCSAKMRSDAISICHGIWFDHNNYSSFYNIRSNQWFQHLFRAFNNPKRIISVDTNSINIIRAIFPELASKMTFIPNFVNNAIFYPPKEERNNSKLVVLFPRRSQINRGSRILPEIIKNIPYDVDFYWIGEGDDNDTKLIKDYCKKDTRLHYGTSTFDEMPDWYRKADIVVIPTIACEGTSLSCIEALASGCAVVATNVCGFNRPDF